MERIKTILVDDEKDSREILARYLAKYCPQVELLDECTNILEAEKAIEKFKPQLVFLDIEMPHGNAFDLLERLHEINFSVIFITAYDQYAVKAFQLSASNYLLKPVNIEELENAVDQVLADIVSLNKFDQVKVLLENLSSNKTQNQKLVLPVMEGFEVVKMEDILYCEADDNFTLFHFKNGQKKMICRNLKHYEKVLDAHGFCRIHRSLLVNLEYVTKYNKGKGGSLILENGKELIVSGTRKSDFVNRLKSWM